MDEEQSHAARGDADEFDTGDGEVDAQQLLNAAARAIATVRRQAAGLLRHRRDVHDDDDRAEEDAD